MGEAICKANASQLGKLGAKIRWERARIAKLESERTAQIRDLSAALTAAELREMIENRPQGHPPKPKADSFVEQTLRKVRVRIGELIEAMEGAPAGIDKFASALGKLAEIERQLAGRPMPGSLKPPAPKAERRQALTHATPEPEPEPIAPPADLLSRPA